LNDEEMEKLTFPTGASFGIVPMVNTWNYFTAYMVVSSTEHPPPSSPREKKKRTDLRRKPQLFGLFVGIFLLGIPIYFLNPKVREFETKQLPRLIFES
jgi:hypothetical protein